MPMTIHAAYLFIIAGLLLLFVASTLYERVAPLVDNAVNYRENQSRAEELINSPEGATAQQLVEELGIALPTAYKYIRKFGK